MHSVHIGKTMYASVFVERISHIKMHTNATRTYCSPVLLKKEGRVQDSIWKQSVIVVGKKKKDD